MREARAGKRDGIGAALLVGTLALYLLFPNRDYLGDGLLYALDVEQGQRLFHPHHLLYNATGYVLFHLLQPLGVQRALAPMMGLNMLTGALAVGVFYGILRSLTDERWLSGWGAMLFALSFGWWLYAISVETYTLPILFLLLALRQIARHPIGSALSPGWLARLALWTALACLYHQSHIFFIPGVLLLLWGRLGAGRRPLLIYLLLTSLLIALPYGLAAVIEGVRSPGEFTYWLTSYAHRGLWGLGLSWRSLPLFVSTLARSVWALPKGLWWSSQTMGQAAALLLGLAFAGALALLLWQHRAHLLSRLRREWPWAAAAVLWLAGYGGFTFWWQPGNVEFVLPLLVPFWLLIGLALQGSSGRLAPLMVVAVAALFLNNFAGRVLPASDLHNNEGYQAAAQLAQYVSPDALLIVDDYAWQLNLRYFYGRTLDAVEGLKRQRLYSSASKEEAAAALRETIDTALGEGRQVVTLEYDEREPLLLREARSLAFSQEEVEAFYDSHYRLEPLFRLTGELGPYWAYQLSAK